MMASPPPVPEPILVKASSAVRGRLTGAFGITAIWGQAPGSSETVMRALRMARASPTTCVRGTGCAARAMSALDFNMGAPPLATFHGVGVALPMVNDALMV